MIDRIIEATGRLIYAVENINLPQAITVNSYIDHLNNILSNL